jgi:hypothetical protein
VEFIVTADVGNFLLFQVYNTLNSYPSSFRKSMARGNAYCRFPLHQDFKESWKVMMVLVVDTHLLHIAEQSGKVHGLSGAVHYYSPVLV